MGVGVISALATPQVQRSSLCACLPHYAPRNTPTGPALQLPSPPARDPQVLDLSGNGVIDSGRELFGDNTLLPSGQLATNGFHALSQYDSNGDGKVSSLDAIYSQLRIWQDANQDGISQASELTTLAQQGVAGINLTATQTNTALGGGNTQTWTGSFTRTDGSTGTAAGMPCRRAWLRCRLRAKSGISRRNDCVRRYENDSELKCSLWLGSGYLSGKAVQTNRATSIDN